MMKKALKVIAGVALAGCMLLPIAACSDTDNSEEVKQLQQQIQDLQTEIDSLKNDNVALTGCPKFEYNIDETISYYVSGTKIFDFKINKFHYEQTSTTAIRYTVTFIPSVASQGNTGAYFTATLYDTVTNTLYSSNSNASGSMYFNVHTGNKSTLVINYFNQPIASITATPTKFVN